jgi:hypothetical protein
VSNETSVRAELMCSACAWHNPEKCDKRISCVEREQIRQAAYAAGMARMPKVEDVGRRLLAKWNREREGTGEWPNGQEWDELAASSQSTLLRHACELLGIDWSEWRGAAPKTGKQIMECKTYNPEPK